MVPRPTKHPKKNSAPLVPWPLQHYLSKLEGGGGWGGVAYKDRARLPPPPLDRMETCKQHTWRTMDGSMVKYVDLGTTPK